ncbi:MAG: YceI family protein [Pseudohongiellaceae bacterium]|nr:YceI family protein [Pseudohongiellaceae bacterium]
MFNKSFSQFRRVALILGASALLASCDRLLTPDFNTDVAELRGGGYTLDKDHASLVFNIDHLGFSTFIGSFDAFDASLDFDPENIENSSLEVIVDMNSLDINLPEFEEELLGDNWFDAATFPQAVYRTTSYLGEAEDGTHNFQGDLTMHGVTAPVVLNVKFNGGGRNFLTRKYTLGFQAQAQFLRSEFGVDRFTNFGVGDDITLDINVEFQEAEE